MGAIKPQALLAEFVGTFFLVMTWCHVGMSGSALGALSVASALMVSVYALGAVSGANFNPAVSLGLALAGLVGHDCDMSFAKMGAYWATQLIAGILAAVTAGIVHSTDFGGASSWDPSNATVTVDVIPWGSINSLGPGAGYPDWSIFPAEATYTCLLVLVVLSVATCGDEKSSGGGENYYFGISIGFVIVAAAMAIGEITQCSLNPAVTIGAATGSIQFGDASFTTALAWFAIYSISELFGAACACGFFYVCRSWMIGKNKNKPIDPSMVSKLVAELLGTFYLVLTVCLCVQATSPQLIAVVGIASSLMVMIFAMGKVSGANFNPAVSFGLLCLRVPGFTIATFALYFLVQLIGALLAVIMSMILHSGWKKCVMGLNQKPEENAVTGTWGMIAGSEIAYTCLLVLCVLNAAVKNPPNQYYGLAIGFVIVAGGVAVGGMSGGMFNPAVAFGIDMGAALSQVWGTPVGGTHGWSPVYALFEFIGAGIAVGLTMGMRTPFPAEYEAGEEEEEEEGDPESAEE